MKKLFSIVAALMFVGSLVAAVYEKAAFADITASDEVIITTAVEDVYYALVNTEATSDKPNTEIVTVVSDAIETDVTNLQWNIVAIEDSLVLFPAGQTDLHLSYIASGNNLRVNNNGKLFGFKFTADECLQVKSLDESKGLNLALTNAKDKWGHFSKNTVITFFKKKSSAPEPPITNIYTLTISSSEGGTVNTEVNGEYEAGTEVTIIATPEDGYEFIQWSDGDRNAERNYKMPANDVNLQALFYYDVKSSATWYGVSAKENKFLSFSFEDRGKEFVKATTSASSVKAGDYVEGNWVTVEASNKIKVREFDDIEDGEAMPDAEELYKKAPNGLTDMSYDLLSREMYGVAGNKLYMVDLESGEAEELGTFSYNDNPISAAAIAVDAKRTIYILAQGTPGALFTVKDIVADRKVLLTEVGNPLNHGEIGVDVTGDEQSMAFDHVTGELFWGASDYLRLLDLDEPKAHIVGDLGQTGGAQGFIKAMHRKDKKVTVRVKIADGQDAYGSVSITPGSGAKADVIVGSKIMISAKPNDGYKFLYWRPESGTGDDITDAKYTFMPKKNVTYEAYFKETNVEYNLTISAGAGGAVNETVNGLHDEGATVMIIATADDGYVFDQWSDGNTDNPRYITITQDVNLVANFADYSIVEDTLTVAQALEIAQALSPEKGTTATTTVMYAVEGYVAGISAKYENTFYLAAEEGAYGEFYVYKCQLVDTEVAMGDYVIVTGFISHYYGENSRGEFHSYEMDGGILIHSIPPTTINTLVMPENAGLVRKTFVNTNEYRLEAVPNNNYHFVQWSDEVLDNPRIIVVTQDTTFTAEFALNYYSVSVSSNDNTKGSVTGGGEYEYGSVAKLVAIPETGFQFNGWSDGSVENPHYVSVLGNASYTAYFDTKMCQLAIKANDIMAGGVKGAGTFEYGEQVEISARANSGYQFVKWSNGETYNPYVFTIVDDMELVAFFQRTEADPVNVDEVVVTPDENSANIQWPQVDNAYTYTLIIWADAAQTEKICTLVFDASGRLQSINFNKKPRTSTSQTEQLSGFSFTVTGLDENTEYFYSLAAKDEHDNLIGEEEKGNFTTKGTATGIDEINSSNTQTVKLLKQGQLYILRNGEVYNAQGARVE